MIPGRAETPEQKRAVVERILAVWERYPLMRLGQLLENSLTVESDRINCKGWFQDYFFTEDEDMARIVEQFDRSANG